MSSHVIATLKQHNIPITEAHISLYEQLERFEMCRENRDGTHEMMLQIRLRMVSIYHKICPEKSYRPEAVLAAFSYIMAFHKHHIRTDAIPADLVQKTTRLMKRYAVFRAADGFPKADHADLRCCAVMDQCYLIAQCHVFLSFDIARNWCARAALENHFNRLHTAKKWATEPGFKTHLEKETAKATGLFEQKLGRPPKIKAYNFQ